MVARKIFIVENDERISSKIAIALLSKGFTVNLAKSGAEAIERIARDIPDLVCVNMNLTDITGEIVIKKLKQMAKTSRIKALLYVYSIGLNEEITDHIRNKEGIDKLVEVKEENNLVDAVEDLLR